MALVKELEFSEFSNVMLWRQKHMAMLMLSNLRVASKYILEKENLKKFQKKVKIYCN